MCFTEPAVICSDNNVQATTSWQFLDSPNYPNDYPNSRECGTNIQGIGPIELEIVAFNTESRYDYVRIYKQQGGEEIVRLSGSHDGGANYRSGRTTMYVKFKSNRRDVRSGFRFRFRHYTQSKHIPLHSMRIENDFQHFNERIKTLNDVILRKLF